MNFSRRWALVALLGVPVALFFVAKTASQKRPIKLAIIPSAYKLKFSSDGKTLAVGTSGARPDRFHILDIATGQEIGQQLHGNNDINAYDIGPLLSPNAQQIARVEDFESKSLRTGKYRYYAPRFYVKKTNLPQERIIEDPVKRVGNEGDTPANQEACWTSDGKELVVVGVRQVRRFDALSGKVLSCAIFAPASEKTAEGYSVSATDARELRAVSLSEDGKWLARVENSSLVALRDTTTGQIKRRFYISSGYEDWSSVGLSPQNKLLWVANDDVFFFDALTGKFKWKWRGVSFFHISQDEKVVVACNGSNCVARDAQKGRELWRTTNPSSLNFALSPDGKTFAEVGNNAQIFLWPMPRTD